MKSDLWTSIKKGPFIVADVSLLLCVFLSFIGCSAFPSDDAGDPTGIYVSANNGSDVTGSGKSNDPFKSITVGVATARSSSTVYVSSGVYDETNGEVFPIVLSGNIRLVKISTGNTVVEGVGEYSSSTLATIIDAAIVSIGNNRITGFIISSPNGIAVFVDEQSGAKIENNTIYNSEYGIVVASFGETSVHANIITSNTNSGIVTTSRAMPQITGNQIQENAVGISIYAESDPVIGLFDSYGMNTISGNIACDCLNNTSNAVQAVGNNWDLSIEQLSIQDVCSDGNDIVSPLGTVIYEAIPNPSVLLFDDTTPIDLFTPGKNAVLTTATPTFSWQRTTRNLVVVGVFDNPIRVSNGRIENEDDLVWIWHTGLPDGDEGNILFSEGAGSYYGQQSPEPLEVGQSYYWAVWAWNNEGAIVTHSSPQSRFSVSY